MSELPRPNVGWKLYKTEFACVILALLAPIISWLVTDPKESAEWIGRSVSLMVLFSVYGEYQLQKRNAVKFITNAIRAQHGGQPLGFSKMAVIANVLLLCSAAFGTFIWGYGDKIF